MTDDPNARKLAAHLERPEGGERRAERATDVYTQAEEGAPFILEERRPGLSPVEAVRELAERYRGAARIERNLWTCDLWTLEGAEDGPHRVATVWRAPESNGELAPPVERLEVEE